MIYALHFYFFVLCYWKVSLSFVAMWGSRLLVDSEEIDILRYEKYMLSLKIKYLDNKISRLNERCDLYKANHQVSDFEGKKKAINIDYNTQLQNILDDFLMSNQDHLINLKFSVVILLRKHMNLNKSWLRWRLSVRILWWTTIQKW